MGHMVWIVERARNSPGPVIFNLQTIPLDIEGEEFLLRVPCFASYWRIHAMAEGKEAFVSQQPAASRPGLKDHTA